MAGIKLEISWLISLPHGVLKLAQILLAIIVLICMSAADLALAGAGFVQFTATASLVVGILHAVLYAINVPATILHFPWNFAQLIISGFFSLFYFISLIVASVLAARANWFPHFNTHGCYTAAAIFTVGATFVWAAEMYLEMKSYRETKYRETEMIDTDDLPPAKDLA